MHSAICIGKQNRKKEQRYLAPLSSKHASLRSSEAFRWNKWMKNQNLALRNYLLLINYWLSTHTLNSASLNYLIKGLLKLKINTFCMCTHDRNSDTCSSDLNVHVILRNKAKGKTMFKKTHIFKEISKSII